jgi:hypothetical protein
MSAAIACMNDIGVCLGPFKQTAACGYGKSALQKLLKAKARHSQNVLQEIIFHKSSWKRVNSKRCARSALAVQGGMYTLASVCIRKNAE